MTSLNLFTSVPTDCDLFIVGTIDVLPGCRPLNQNEGAPIDGVYF
jgi:hypothetical protein